MLCNGCTLGCARCSRCFFGMAGSLSAAMISRIIKIVWENHTYSAPLTEGGVFYCQFCRKSAHVLFIPSCSCRKKQNCAVKDEHCFSQSFISFLNCWINSTFAFYLSICNMENLLPLPCSYAEKSLRGWLCGFWLLREASISISGFCSFKMSLPSCTDCKIILFFIGALHMKA